MIRLRAWGLNSKREFIKKNLRKNQHNIFLLKVHKLLILPIGYFLKNNDLKN